MRSKSIIFVICALMFVSTTQVIFSMGGEKDHSISVFLKAFANESGDPSLDKIAGLASKWIKVGLDHAKLFVNAAEKDKGDARAVVLGKIVLKDGTAVFKVKISDSKNKKKSVLIGPITCLRKNPLKGIDLLREKVMGALGVMYDPWCSDWVDLASPTPTYAAYLQYVQGLKYFSQFNYPKSIMHLEKAHALDPDFVPAVSQQYWAYGNQGKDAEADVIAGRMVKMRSKMGPRDRLFLSLIHNEIQGNIEGQLEIVREMGKLQGKTSIGYLHGLIARWANHPFEAVKAFQAQDLTNPMFKGWKGAWYSQYALALHMCKDYKQELELARRYAKDYPKYQWPYTLQGCALAAMGKTAEAEKLIQNVVASKEISGIRGNFIRRIGFELQRHGHTKAAQRCFEHSIKLFTSLKAKEWKKRRADAAWSYYAAKQYDKAEALYKKLAAENPDNFSFQGGLACSAARRGDRKEAMRIFSQLGEIKDPDSILPAKYRQSMIAAILGKKETAVKLLRELFDGGWAYGPGWLINPNFLSLHKYKPFKMLFKAKG